MLKSCGVVGGGGGPCDFSVSPSPFGLDFGTLDFGLGLDTISNPLQTPRFNCVGVMIFKFMMFYKSWSRL